ncbi:MAG: hypothetical protein TE42_02295 [Candidatus Synechococcus spongiarum SP3]|uniref:UPF0033 domain-containing protein n=1 Tax=Candidatus Synechococcus spongiarum SP3 TaxID=1604020 RepID=A0A0G2IWW0_9SYNE|nr:MAG: hypothetical protein TE42_02295 [Candidatus Synechococcus spongiarum SP3]
MNIIGLDLRGVPCPLNAVRCQLAFEKLAVGEGLRVELDSGEPLESVVNQFLEAGQQVDVEMDSGQDATILITRLSPWPCRLPGDGSARVSPPAGWAC